MIEGFPSDLVIVRAGCAFALIVCLLFLRFPERFVRIMNWGQQRLSDVSPGLLRFNRAMAIVVVAGTAFLLVFSFVTGRMP